MTENGELENLQNFLMDTDIITVIRKNLLDLLKERDCNIYIVDTAIKDMDIWPAPLLTVPEAWSKNWIFLLSKPSDASGLQPIPRNTRLLNRNDSSAEEIASIIKKQIDPESRKRIIKVKFLEDAKTFLLWMENMKTYALKMSDLPEADSTGVKKWSLSRKRDHILIIQESGNRLEVPWDIILYLYEPEYEYYKEKQFEKPEVEKGRIGLMIREHRTKKGYSVQALADKIGIKRPNLSRLEHGHHQPSLETLEKIAEALEIPVVDLIAR